mgnify:CR=1 FL=1
MGKFSFYNRTEHKRHQKNFFGNIINSAAEQLKIKKELGLSVNLVTIRAIRKLNNKYRKKDKPTDVLSFPLHAKLDISKLKPDHAIIELGDIFICPDMARADARKEKMAFDQKMAYLVVHGFLHLLGFDHEKNQSEAKKMFALQNKILNI